MLIFNDLYFRATVAFFSLARFEWSAGNPCTYIPGFSSSKVVLFSPVLQRMRAKLLHEWRLRWSSSPFPLTMRVKPAWSLQLQPRSSLMPHSDTRWVWALDLLCVFVFVRPVHQKETSRSQTNVTATPGGSQRNSWSITPISSKLCSLTWTLWSWVCTTHTHSLLCYWPYFNWRVLFTGGVAKNFFTKSKLPIPELSHIW